MTIIIQNTWNQEDDQELLEFFQSQGKKYQVMSGEEILKLNPKSLDVLFADTSIVQRLLGNLYQTVDTYPDCFKTLYKRQIQKRKFVELETIRSEILKVGGKEEVVLEPFFVKPYTNDKLFDAQVIKNYEDLYYFATYCGADDDYFYQSSIFNFVNEYRMFIADSKLFAIVESSDYILNSDTIIRLEPPREFIQQIIDANVYPWVIIDIGMNSGGVWAVVEANPPFALSSYGLDIQRYFNYCQMAWIKIITGRIQNI